MGKNSYSGIVAGLVAGLLSLGPASAATLNWDGGGASTDWFTAANWSDPGTGEAVPTVLDDVDFYGAGTPANPVVINNASPAAALTLDMTAAGQNIASYLDVHTTLNIDGRFSVGTYQSANVHQYNNSHITTAGSFSVDSRDQTSSYVIDGSGTTLHIGTTGAISRHGYLIQNNGEVTVGGDFLVAGVRDRAGGGAYEMNGGSLTVNSAGSVGAFANGMAVGFQTISTMVHSGGSVTINNGNLEMGTRSNAGITGDGNYVVQGGAVLDVNGSVVMGSTTATNSNVGRFTVSGSGNGSAAIDVNGWTQHGLVNGLVRGRLQLEPDAAGLIIIDVHGNVVFDDGAVLDINPLYVPAIGDSWAVMTWTGSLTTSGLVLSSTTAPGWTFDLGVTTANTLTITYIPEPASLAMLGFSGWMMMVRSRRAA